MSWLGDLIGKIVRKSPDLGDVIAKVLIGKREAGRLKLLPVGGTAELPKVRADLPGGYFELTILARKLDDD